MNGKKFSRAKFTRTILTRMTNEVRVEPTETVRSNRTVRSTRTVRSDRKAMYANKDRQDKIKEANPRGTRVDKGIQDKIKFNSFAPHYIDVPHLPLFFYIHPCSWTVLRTLSGATSHMCLQSSAHCSVGFLAVHLPGAENRILQKWINKFLVLRTLR